MAYSSFSSDWTKPLVGSFQESLVDDDLHDESDYGDGAHRAATTKNRVEFSYIRRCGTVEKDAIVTFAKTVKTVTPFYWTSPFTAETKLVRFAQSISFSPAQMSPVWDLSISLVEI